LLHRRLATSISCNEVFFTPSPLIGRSLVRKDYFRSAAKEALVVLDFHSLNLRILFSALIARNIALCWIIFKRASLSAAKLDIMIRDYLKNAGYEMTDHKNV
jgi:hypothetical protein